MTQHHKNFLPFLALLLSGLVGSVEGAFIDHGDGTVTDTVTGLMWDKCSWGQSDTGCATGTASPVTWAQALGVAVIANAQNDGTGYKNHNDWRLPNRTELYSLVKTDEPLGIDLIAFPNTPSTPFWSSTVLGPNPANGAWGVVFFLNGGSSAYLPSSPFLVRLVRSGQSFSAFDLLAPRVGGAWHNWWLIYGPFRR